MSHDDGLDEIRKALRGVGGSSDRAAATKARILTELLAQRRRRKVRLLRIVLPLAATLAVSSAWAAASGRLAPVLGAVSALFQVTEGVEDENAASAHGKTAKGEVSAREAPDVADEAEPFLAEPEADETDEGRAEPFAETEADVESSSLNAERVRPGRLEAESVPSRRASRPKARVAAPTRAPNPAPGSEAVALEDTGADELRVYEVAHRAHFVQRDDARALAGWDAYLAAYPRGRFVPEARYNRAINLRRLGRTDEAREALRPFAEGRFRGYRQREAAALLEELSDEEAEPRSK